MTGSELQGWIRPLEVPGAADALKAIVQAPLIGIPPSEIAHIRVPAAVMLGAGDPTITVDRARKSAGWLHTRTVVAVPGARHLPMISNPRLFVHDVTHIVRRLRAASTEAR
jgi:pimeloyl-ACP methyl ester carboxylesterase